MTGELVFRVIFSVLWLIFFACLIQIRYAAGGFSPRPPSGQKPRRERRWHIAALALSGPLWFAGLLLYSLAPDWIRFLSFPLPDWFRLAMVVVAALGEAFALWGYRALGSNWVHALEPSDFIEKKDGTLVTTGPYAYVRNPVYLGTFTLFLALALIAGNWLLLVPGLFMVILISLQIDNEERMLLARFGDEYREYMKRTPRIIPKFRGIPPVQGSRQA